MKLRLAIIGALISSTLASAADAPSNLALTECRLNREAALQQTKKLKLVDHRMQGSFDWGDSYQLDEYDYAISERPFGLTATTVRLTVTEYDDGDDRTYKLFVGVSESYDKAKAKLFAAYGTRTCSYGEESPPKRSCLMKKENARLPTLFETDAGASISCPL